MNVLQGGVVSPSPNPQAGGPPLIGCPRLLIQFIRSYPPYRRPFLYPQAEDAPCRGDGLTVEDSQYKSEALMLEPVCLISACSVYPQDKIHICSMLLTHILCNNM